MKNYDLGKLPMFPAVPIGFDESDPPIPITPEEPPALISPIILSPPSQPLTPFWTMKTETPWPDPGQITEDITISPALANDMTNNPTNEASPVIETPRNRSRAHTIESVNQVIKIKQDVEKWKDQQVEVETEGIRAMKALQERYRLEGRPWITGSGNDPVQVWVEEWKFDPPSYGEREAALETLNSGEISLDTIPEGVSSLVEHEIEDVVSFQ